MRSLFGDEIPDTDKKPHSPYKAFKARYNYRKSYDKTERCKTCKYCGYFQYGTKYYKCKLMGLSHSNATDIRVNNICDKWEASE